LEVDMKIGVSGASGHLGRAVVSELLRRPEQRRPMVFAPNVPAANTNGMF
jgi:uncharacterized protein YbjT (DUF2867 family)